MPVYLIFTIVMMLMSFASFNYNKILFLVEIGLSLVALAVVLFLMFRFKKYLRTVVFDSVMSIADISKDYIESYKLPCAVVGEFGEILLYNEKFEKLFFKNHDAVGDSVFCYFRNDTAETLLRSVGGVETDFDGKKLTVYSNKVDKGYMLTVVDNTYLKQIEKKYYETKKSVALVYFDNSNDSSADREDEDLRALITVESLLSRWSAKHDCLYRKLSDDKYLIIFDEKVLVTQIEKKFRILDKIRQVELGERKASISIGIGRGCDTLKESHQCAKKALDMALGRGGDQVAILNKGEYEFYGGVSKGVEKTSKVRVRIIAESVKNAIENADKVLIMGHKFSDLDCVGAAAGIHSSVTKVFSKRAYIVCDTEKSMAKQLIENLSQRNKDMFISVDRALSMISEKTLLFVVDTHSPDFVESPKVYKMCSKVIVIDHHRKMVKFIENADVFFHEPTASSACEMVTELISYLGDDGLSKIEAEGLLAGIMLDTKNFVINTGVRTFEAAASLRKKGADTVTVRNMFSSSIDSYKSKHEIVARSVVYDNCAISTVNGIVKNARVLSAQAADEMLTISDVYASFVLAQLDSKTVNISARSYGKINVQLIMEKLGGGGHQNMAAVQLNDTTLEKAKEQLISIIKSQ